MCTCLKLSNYFGRTLDLECHYLEEVVVTPRNYLFKNKNALTFKSKYAMIGTAMVVDNYPLYYEASNEMGLAIAGLNFPLNAHYNDPIKGKLNLSAFELIPYFLGNYSKISEFKDKLKDLNITNTMFNAKMGLTPLHFMFSDKEGSLVIEQSLEGLKIYENKVGVMTNNPPFDMQLKNLDKYKNLTPNYVKSDDIRFNCVGLGALNLPGDYSSMSRFVKTSFLAKFTKLKEDDEEYNVTQFFHILDSVLMIEGTVHSLDNNKEDITFYSSCINTLKGIYYYKTYNNNQINALRLTNKNMNSKELYRYKIIDSQKINYLN